MRPGGVRGQRGRDGWGGGEDREPVSRGKNGM